MGTATASPQNIKLIKSILEKNGLSPMAVAASLARFSAESKFDPNARNPKDGADGSDSIGINQWNAGRARALKKFAADQGTTAYDVATQAQFYADEVNGKYGGQEAKYGSRLAKAQTADEAAQAVMGMVRPQGWSAGNPTGGLGYKATLADTARFASGDLSIRGYRGKSLTGATTADSGFLPANDRGLMQGSKSAGRTAEEGDQPLTVPDLAAFGADLSQPQVAIDNTPGGKVGQALMGLLGVAGKFQEDSTKKNPGGNIFGKRVLQSSENVPNSPSAHSIAAMIQNMGK